MSYKECYVNHFFVWYLFFYMLFLAWLNVNPYSCELPVFLRAADFINETFFIRISYDTTTFLLYE